MKQVIQVVEMHLYEDCHNVCKPATIQASVIIVQSHKEAVVILKQTSEDVAIQKSFSSTNKTITVIIVYQ